MVFTRKDGDFNGRTVSLPECIFQGFLNELFFGFQIAGRGPVLMLNLPFWGIDHHFVCVCVCVCESSCPSTLKNARGHWIHLVFYRTTALLREWPFLSTLGCFFGASETRIIHPSSFLSKAAPASLVVALPVLLAILFATPLCDLMAAPCRLVNCFQSLLE